MNEAKEPNEAVKTFTEQIESYIEGMRESGDFDSGEISDSVKEKKQILREIKKLDNPTSEDIKKICSDVYGDDGGIYEDIMSY